MLRSVLILVAVHFSTVAVAGASTLSTPDAPPRLPPAEQVPITCALCDAAVPSQTVIELAPVSPVPEPEALPMALAGVFAIWFLARRQSKCK